jgi:hypothetical protein
MDSGAAASDHLSTGPLGLNPHYMRTSKQPSVISSARIGFQAFLVEGGEKFGAVRMVGPRELVVYVENSGDFLVDTSAVKRVHDGKVIVDGSRIDDRLRNAITHAHDRES